MYYYDKAYILVIIAIIFAMYAQGKISSSFNKNSKILSKKGYTGKEVARMILDKNGLTDVDVRFTQGNLTDHYDPRNKTIKLSENVYNSSSVAAVSVAAHEVGHAIQDGEGYVPLKLRSSLVPVVNFASRFVFLIIFLGFMFYNVGNGLILNIGIAIFMVTVLFQIVTLPVEINASKRALMNLEEGGILEQDEVSNGKDVLKAAALTYIASTLVAVAQLLRLISNSRRRD